MSLTAYRIGSAAWIFTGIAHDVLDFVLPGDPEVEAVLHESVLQIGPIALPHALLIRGVSLAMGVAMIVVGVLLWMVGDALRDLPDRLARFVVVALIGSIVTLALSVIYVPGPPLVTFTVATIAFTVALIRVRRTVRESLARTD